MTTDMVLEQARTLWGAGYRAETFDWLRSNMGLRPKEPTLYSAMGLYYLANLEPKLAAHCLVLALLYGERRPEVLTTCAGACAEIGATNFAAAIAQVNYDLNGHSTVAFESFKLHIMAQNDTTVTSRIMFQMTMFMQRGMPHVLPLAKLAKDAGLYSVALELVMTHDTVRPAAETLLMVVELHILDGNEEGAAHAHAALALLSTRTSPEEIVRKM